MRKAPRAAWIAAAVACTCVVVAPPLDRLADESLAWHMVQHLAMVYAVPVAFLLADPFGWWVRTAGKQTVRRTAQLAAPLQAVAHPAVAFVAFVGVLWFVHFSRLYEAALENAAVHAAEHVLFVLAGVLFWLPLIAPPPVKPVSFPARLLYCVVLLPQGALVAMAIGAAREPLYAHYASLLGTAGAVADQRDAAAVMWIAGGLVGLGAFLGTLAAWAKRETSMESV